MSTHDLNGLRADNLVAFMAAVGCVRTSTLIWPEARPKLYWRSQSDGWYAALQLDANLTDDALIEGLDTYLKAQIDSPAFHLADDLTIPIDDFHQALETARRRTNHTGSTEAEFLAAFGSEAVQSLAAGKPSGKIADTAFRTMSGAGNQHLFKVIRTLVEDTDATHLRCALLSPWTYRDPMKNHSLRWDPVDDIRYALQWTEPSKDKDRDKSGCMWGAYRLAIEALPLFPVMPEGNGLRTTGFTEQPGNTRITWPVWDAPANIDTIRSLLALTDLQQESVNHVTLQQRGIQAAFRSRRVTLGKFRNFTAAQPA